MRYWDASALVPLIVSEPDSALVRTWLSEDDRIVTWVWTRTEIASAVERRTREGLLTRPQRGAVLERLDALAATWDEVTDVLAIRTRATGLLARHPLRAADAGQLGAALLVHEQVPGTLSFVCLDGRLALAAELEGLRVVTRADEPAAAEIPTAVPTALDHDIDAEGHDERGDDQCSQEARCDP